MPAKYLVGIGKSMGFFGAQLSCPECLKAHKARPKTCEIRSEEDLQHLTVRGANKTSPEYLRAVERRDVMREYMAMKGW